MSLYGNNFTRETIPSLVSIFCTGVVNIRLDAANAMIIKLSTVNEKVKTVLSRFPHEYILVCDSAKHKYSFFSFKRNDGWGLQFLLFGGGGGGGGGGIAHEMHEQKRQDYSNDHTQQEKNFLV